MVAQQPGRQPARRGAHPERAVELQALEDVELTRALAEAASRSDSEQTTLLAGEIAARAGRRARFVRDFQHAILFIDQDRTIVDVDTSAGLVLGIPRGQLVGRDFHDALCGHDASAPCIASIVIRTGQEVREERSTLRAPGLQPKQFSLTAYPTRIAGSARVDGGTLVLREAAHQRRSAEAFEQAIRRTEERFGLLVANLPGAVYRCEAEPPYHALYLSTNIETITGHPREELLTELTWMDLAHEDDVSAVTLAIEEAMAKREAFHVQYRIHHADGGIRWVEETGRGLYDERGVPRFIDGILVDVTDRERNRRELRLTEERYRLLADHSTDMITLLDADLKILYASPASRRLTGFPAEEMIGRSIFELIHPEDAAHVREVQGAAISTPGSSVRVRFRFLRNDGSWFWAEASGEALPPEAGSGPARYLGSFRDVTDLVEAQERILALNEEALHRVAELTAMNHELEAFSYSASHDLRAPLRALTTLSEITLDEEGDKMTEAGRKALTRVQVEAHRMSRLVDDLLRLSKVSRGDFTLTDVELEPIVREIVAALEERDPTRRVHVVVGDPMHARCDARLTRIALENLLGNAWKYTARRPDARIEVGRIPTEEGDAFFVRDNGVGFDMRQAEKLFQPFQRLHGASGFEGTGIGLATVRRVVERHGGRVWAEGAVDAGATFWFTLGPRPAPTG